MKKRINISVDVDTYERLIKIAAEKSKPGKRVKIAELIRAYAIKLEKRYATT